MTADTACTSLPIYLLSFDFFVVVSGVFISQRGERELTCSVSGRVAATT